MTEPLLKVADRSPSELIICALFPAIDQAELFEFFTNDKQICRWWAAQAEIVAKPGGNYWLKWPKMDLVMRGEIKLFKSPETLCFSWNWDHEPDLTEKMVEINFSSRTSGSAIILTQSGYGSDTVDLQEQPDHKDGWFHFLGILQSLGQVD